MKRLSVIFRNIFSKQEAQFISIFAIVFLVTVTVLALFGLIPSEFKVNGGETLEQKTRSAVREIIEGKAQNKPNNADKSGEQAPSNATNATNATVINTTKNNPTQTQNKTDDKAPNQNTSIIYAENPQRIVIPNIGVDSIIMNPLTAEHEVLDGELTKGVVRYPGSGLPGAGNMFLFGHSTGFSVVQNKAYKVFNELHNLKTGDTITIYGAVGIYTYSVKTVKKVDKNNALVQFDTKNNMLTLSTCDSFGKASDRYVVEADFVSVVKK